MFENRQRIVVTGGNGFIGKHFVRQILQAGQEVINIDKLTYAADKKIQYWFYEQPNYSFIHGDISNIETLPECDYVVNFAAESHVDNSIRSSRHFTVSNTLGVHNLLELIRAWEPSLRPTFIQISTDEVYGDSLDESFTEESPTRPSNPYAASKAGGEDILRAFARTYGIRYKIIRMSNNYGLRQYPEKLIPRSILRLLTGRKAQLHGDGSYRRTWLHVEDAVQGILTAIVKGEENAVYNISSDVEMTNRAVLEKICAILGIDFAEWVELVANRPGQDVRYPISDARIRDLGWAPTRNFDEELVRIVETMRSDPHW